MRHQTGARLILVAGLVWSTQGLGLRMITEAQSWPVLAWRSLGLTIALTIYVGILTRWQLWSAIKSVGRFGVFGALTMVLAFGGAIYAMQATTIANAVVLFAASPLFAALIGWVTMGEKVRLGTWLAIALALVGITVMVGGQIDMRGLWGNFAALLSALGFGAYSVVLRQMNTQMAQNSGQFPVVLLAGVFSTITGAALSLTLGQDLFPRAEDIGIALTMGIVTLSGGMVLYTLGTRGVTAAAATLLSQVEVILAPLWVWLVFGEDVSRATALGGGIVLAAIVLNVLTAQRRGPQIAGQ